MWLLIFFLSSCQIVSSSYEKQSEKITENMVCLLREVETKEDLNRIAPEFRDNIESLTKIMIKAKKDNIKSSFRNPYAEELKMELERLSLIKGLEGCIEDLERHALHKLDAFDRESKKVKVRSSKTA